MNSVFSPFDAVCAEFFFGPRISAFFTRPDINHGATTPSSFSLKESAPSSQSQAATVNSDCKLSKSAAAAPPARFAPEFDGLNCFETLVSF